jgi:hypothetical protein
MHGHARPAGSRYLVAAALLGLPLSQLGHGLAYLARFGGGGLTLQSQGAHGYFPSLVQLSGALTGATVLGSLFVLGLVRLAVGHSPGYRLQRRQPLIEVLVVLACVQLATYLLQETAEALLSGQPLSVGFLPATLLWGAAGQLPLALAAALALSWLSVRLEKAIGVLRAAREDLGRLGRFPPALLRAGGPWGRHPSLSEWVSAAVSERGPPALLLSNES